MKKLEKKIINSKQKKINNQHQYQYLLFFQHALDQNIKYKQVLILLMRSSFCLESVTSSRQINQSPLNRSSSKNLWSFAKDLRFKQPKVYCDSIYETPSTILNKGAGIGYGKKSDFTKDLTVSPGSSKYNLKTIFDQNGKTKKGFSISLSREKIPSKGYIALQPLKVPAPNKYNNLKLDTGHRYSMRKKTIVSDKTMSIQAQNNNPGAGKYQNPQALSPRGKYTVSKHRGTGATLFNPKSSIRFFELKKQVPGPGSYHEINALSDRGYYPISSTTGYGKRFFDKQIRVAKFEHQAKNNYIPGPGSYRSPSDFGQYDGNVYNLNLTMYKTILSKNNSKSKLNSTLRSTSRNKL